MAADTQVTAADTGTNVAVVPICNMCHLPKPGPLCLHCDQPCSIGRAGGMTLVDVLKVRRPRPDTRCSACSAGARYDGIGPPR